MELNENNFIEYLKLGKESALEFIVDKYLPLIKGITYKVLSPLQNDGLIEECINDVFLSVWHNARKFQGEANDFKKWICAIAKFKAIDYYRKEIKNTEVTTDYLEVSNEYSVEDELIQLENRNELIALINELDPLDRDIFMMRYFLGVKPEDIALKLGMTRGAVDNRIYRGKKKLNKEAENLILGGSAI